jgi:hypothetical protein
LFDLSFITDPLATIAQWVGYGLIGIFAVGSLFLLVVVPVMFKVAAVAFARVLVVETSNIIAKSGIANQISNAVDGVTKATNEITKQINKQNNFEVVKIERSKIDV